ncbi:MAG: Na(+)-translocating NADH-quinone reductase subunit F [Bacteroidia bacterium]|nr:Na(+)-translocating NADH-quinone reductase subunit F [Bacteroidia bacterium]MBT8309180.1 Na(+)-translocating NADH-quinone reductase subunit F [Bacteroidia bacterium]NNL59830.1 Na(+)-translocating NADH-quinone reductase subunit F [Flavobacteriaceae bacterium]
MNYPLTEQDMLEFAMTHVGQELHDLGLKFIEINSTEKKQPQFVCVDEDQQHYYVVVNAVKLPINPYKYNVVWMELFKHQAKLQNAKVLYAGVGLSNIEDETLPIYLDEGYLMKYTGIQSVETYLN